MRSLTGPWEVVVDKEVSPGTSYSNGHEQRWAGGRAWEGQASPGQLQDDPGCPPAPSSTSTLPVLLRATGCVGNTGTSALSASLSSQATLLFSSLGFSTQAVNKRVTQQGCFVIRAPGRPSWAPAPSSLPRVEFLCVSSINTANTNSKLGRNIEHAFGVGTFQLRPITAAAAERFYVLSPCCCYWKLYLKVLQGAERKR